MNGAIVLDNAARHTLATFARYNGRPESIDSETWARYREGSLAIISFVDLSSIVKMHGIQLAHELRFGDPNLEVLVKAIRAILIEECGMPQEIENWDSFSRSGYIAHLRDTFRIVACLERLFDVQFFDDDYEPTMLDSVRALARAVQSKRRQRGLSTFYRAA